MQGNHSAKKAAKTFCILRLHESIFRPADLPCVPAGVLSSTGEFSPRNAPDFCRNSCARLIAMAARGVADPEYGGIYAPPTDHSNHQVFHSDPYSFTRAGSHGSTMSGYPRLRYTVCIAGRMGRIELSASLQSSRQFPAGYLRSRAVLMLREYLRCGVRQLRLLFGEYVHNVSLLLASIFLLIL